MAECIRIESVASLKVVDLRQELEKRGLEKSGLKADLVKRLEKSLIDDSSDFDTNLTAEENILEDKAAEISEEKGEIDIIEQETLSKQEMESEDVNLEFVDSTESLPQESIASNEQDDGVISAPEQQDKPESEEEDEFEDTNDLPEDERGNSLIEDESADIVMQSDAEGESGSEEEEEEEKESGDNDDAGDDTEVDGNEIVNVDFDEQQEDTTGRSEDGGTELENNESEPCQTEGIISPDVSEAKTEADQSIQQHNDQASESVDTIKLDSINDDKLENSTVNQELNEEEEETKNDSNTLVSSGDFIPIEVEEGPTMEDLADAETKQKDDDQSVSGNKDVEMSSSVKTDPENNDIVIVSDTDSNKKSASPNKSEIQPTEKGMTSNENSSSESIRVSLPEAKDGSSHNDSPAVTTKKETKSPVGKPEKSKEEKKKDLNRCLWVSGLAAVTKAVDLKNIFSQHGKVVGAKVVTSAKTPGSQCFGFVTMSTAEEATKCIEKLHKSTLHQKNIQVEKAKTDPTPSKKPAEKTKSTGDKKDEKTRSNHSSTSKSMRGSTSSRSRRDDRSSRRAREDAKRNSDKKDSKEQIKEKKETSSKSKDTKKDDKKVSSDKKGTSSKSTSPNTSEPKSNSKDDKLKTKEQTDTKEVSDKSKTEEKKDVKSLDQLRKERADKIEREHVLREERKKKERERERQLREERRREQEKREKERKERARKEAERVRKEREKQRELEKQREREREKERERFIRERKEREEKERREREKEREQLERERLERERLDRERRERERLEKERIERERQERERLEKERLAREDRIERERRRLEEERLERERLDRDRERRMIDRGIDRGLGSNNLKRPNSDDRGYHPDTKRSLHAASPTSRKDFFATGTNPDIRAANAYVQDDVYDTVYQRRAANGNRTDTRAKHDQRNVARHDTREDLRRGEVRRDSREFDSYEKNRDPHQNQSTDIRRVIQRDDHNDRSYMRDRSPHRSEDSSQKYRNESDQREYSSRERDYDRRDYGQNLLDAPNPNAPKTLSDVLGRAGLTGILGSQAEENSSKSISSYPPRRAEIPTKDYPHERFASGTRRPYDKNDDRENRPYRPDDRGLRQDDRNRMENRDDRRDLRSDNRRERELRSADSRDIHTGVRRDPVTNNYRDLRADERRDARVNDRRDSRNEDRRDMRVEERREKHADTRDISSGGRVSRDRNTNLNQVVSSSTPPLSVTDRRGLHPLAAELSSRALPTVVQPRVVPVDVFGRPLQPVVSNQAAHALQAGYAAAAQGLALQQMAPTGIQLNRDGRLEYTRVGQPPSSMQHMQRRF